VRFDEKKAASRNTRGGGDGDSDRAFRVRSQAADEGWIKRRKGEAAKAGERLKASQLKAEQKAEQNVLAEKFSVGEVVQTEWGVATVRRGWGDGDYDLAFPGYNEPFCCSEDQLMRMGDTGKSAAKRTSQRESQPRPKKERRRQSLAGRGWKHQTRRNGRFQKETDEEAEDEKEEDGEEVQRGTRVGLEYQAAIPALGVASFSDLDQTLGKKAIMRPSSISHLIICFELRSGGTLVDSETVARPAVLPPSKLKRKPAQSIAKASSLDSTASSLYSTVDPRSTYQNNFPATLSMKYMLDPLSWLSYSKRAHFEYTLRPHADQKVPVLLSDLSTKASPSSSTSSSPMSSPFAGTDGLTLYAPPSPPPMSSSMTALFTAAGATAAGATAASRTPPDNFTDAHAIYAPYHPTQPEAAEIVSIDENGKLMVGTLQQPFRFSFPGLGDSAGNNGFWAHNPYLQSWLYPQAGLEQSPLTTEYATPGPAGGFHPNVRCGQCYHFTCVCAPNRTLQPAVGFPSPKLSTYTDSGSGAFRDAAMIVD
jgi:hypothetical protein